MNSVYKKGFKEFIGNPAKNAFKLEKRPLVCIDEGIPEAGIHTTASGLLLGIDKALEFAKKAGVDEVTYHESCGGAAKFAAEHGRPASEALSIAEQFSTELAEKLNVPVRKITADAMIRPAEFHIARIAIYDAAELKSTESIGLPPGFIISRKFLNTEDSLKDAVIAAGIALGGHGFGDLITAENPFMLIAIGTQDDAALSSENLKQELQQLKKEFGARIRIDGFDAPNV